MVTKHLPGLNSSAQGRFRYEILSENGDVIRKSNWQSNLILNYGLDIICASTLICEAFVACHIGTGTTPTIDDLTSTATATISSGIITVSGYDLQSINHQFNMVKLSSGEEYMIMSVTGPTTATVNPVGPDVSTPTGFKIYRTNQTQLTATVKSSSTYATDAGYCGTTSDVATATVVLKRSYNFTTESSDITYKEVGFSANLADAGSNLFSRIYVPAGIPVLAGQKLRIVYELHLTQGVSLSARRISAAISGWPISPASGTDAYEKAECWGLSAVSTTGANSRMTITGSASPMLFAEPSSTNCCIFVSPVSTALITFQATVLYLGGGTGTDLLKFVSLESYTNLSFYRVKYAQFLETEVLRTNIRSIGMGQTGQNDYNSGFRVLFDESQTKEDVATLKLRFIVSISRVLA